jgi:microcystin-dependent protein
VSGIDVARAMGAAFGPGPDQVLYGTIAAVGAHGANTVDVYAGNSAAGVTPTAATGWPYLSGYNPQVGDAVVYLQGQGSSASSHLVLGTVAGSSSGGGSAGVPIGAIQMFPVSITYPNWLLCNGGTFSATTYPALNALLGGTTLPNLVNALPMGAGSIVALGSTAGSATANGLVAHTHGGPSHTHTDSGHSHSHSHTPSGTATNFIATPGSNVPVGTGGSTWGSPSVTTTDSTSGQANLNSASGTTGSAGSGSSFSVLNPVVGVAYYIRAA